MGRRGRPELFALVLGALACGHAHAPPDAQPGPWKPVSLEGLPACASTLEDAISVQAAAGRAAGEEIAVRGYFSQPDWACNLKACHEKDGKPLACCNGCSATLTLVDPAGTGARIYLKLENHQSLLSLSARDCEAGLLDMSALSRWFIASGTLTEPENREGPDKGVPQLDDVRLCRQAL